MCVGEFTLVDINDNCQANEVIQTEVQCKDAAENLGLAYNSKVNTGKHPIGCFYNDEDNEAYFNENVDGLNTWKVHGKYGGVCKIPGKLYHTKI